MKLLLPFLLASVAFGQSSQTITISAPSPPVITGTTVGPGGGGVPYFYLVVAHYASGTSQSQILTLLGPQTLSGTTYNQIGWNALSGALNYDVLKLSTPNFSGTCTCSLIVATTSTTYSDMGGSLSAYTLSASAPGATATTYIDNTDYAFPKLRVNIGPVPGAHQDHLAEVPGGGTLPAFCTLNDIFVKSGSGSGVYFCSAPNTWTITGGGSGVVPFGASLPGTCTLGDVFNLTGQSGYGPGLYFCLSGNNWQINSGGLFNVRNFGATGNGSTDDTAAINTAAAHGAIRVPCGDYLLSSTIVLNSVAPVVEGDSGSTQTSPRNSCVTFIQGNSGTSAMTYTSTITGFQYNNNVTVRLRNFHVFTLHDGIIINNQTIPTAPTNFQGNLVKLEISNVYLQGVSSINTSPNAFTGVLPGSITSLQTYGTGLMCAQCFGMNLTGSLIQNFGVGVYYLGDEALIYANRITLNGINVGLDKAVGGSATFAAMNNVVIDSNVLGGNIRAGAVTMGGGNNIGGVKITRNYFENYCPSSTFLVSAQNAGTDFSQNVIDNPNNNTLTSGNCTYVNNTSPLMVLDDSADIRIHENYLAPNGNSIPGLTLNHSFNVHPYFIYNNGVSFPNNATDTASITFGELNPIIKGNLTVSDSGAIGSGTGTIFLGDGAFNKTPGHGFTFGGAGLETTNIFNSGLVNSFQFQTLTACLSGASPAVCTTSAGGAVAIPTGTNPTLTINTTAVSAGSTILLTPDFSHSIPSTTCNTTLTLAGVLPVVTAKVAGVSFTIQYNGTLTTNPACYNYLVVN